MGVISETIVSGISLQSLIFGDSAGIIHVNVHMDTRKTIWRRSNSVGWIGCQLAGIASPLARIGFLHSTPDLSTTEYSPAVSVNSSDLFFCCAPGVQA